MTEDFSNHPESVTEIRAEKAQMAAAWKPRDVLIALLRDIDSGRLDPEALIVAYIRKGSDPSPGAVSWRAASPSPLLTLGLTIYLFHSMCQTLIHDEEEEP